MTEDPKPDALARAVKTLTVAVWCLCAAVAAQVLLYGWGYFRSVRWARQAITTTTASSTQGSPPGAVRTALAEENSFHELPPEKLVERSSVILLTTYQDDGKRNKAIVAEILKQDPDTILYYAVGDEYPMLSFDKQKDMSCGDGQVVFMVGSPASMRASYGFTNSRIGGLGDMPLTKLREMVKQKKS